MQPSMQESAPPRRSPGRETQQNTRHNPGRKVTEADKELILRHAIDLHTTAPAGEISRIIARRTGFSESIIDWVILTFLMEYRSREACLRAGVLNAMAMAAQAGRDTWEDAA